MIEAIDSLFRSKELFRNFFIISFAGVSPHFYTCTWTLSFFLQYIIYMLMWKQKLQKAFGIEVKVLEEIEKREYTELSRTIPHHPSLHFYRNPRTNSIEVYRK